MIKWYLLVILIVSGCTTTTDGRPGLPTLADIPVEPRETVLEKAQMAQRNKEFDKAIVFYVKSIALEYSDKVKNEDKIPNTEIFYNIGLLEVEQGHNELAATAFKHLLRKEPEHHLAQAQLGKLLLKQKRKKQALVLLDKAITADQIRLGNKDYVDDNFKALDTSSPLFAYTALAVIRDLDGKHDQAIAILQRVLPLSDHDPLIYTNIGYSHYLAGNLIEAELNYKKAIDLDPRFDRAWLNLGLVYTRKGMYTQSLQTLKQVMPLEHAYNDIGYFLMIEGRYNEAEYFLQHAIDLSPTYFIKANRNLENVKLELNKNTHMVYSDSAIKK